MPKHGAVLQDSGAVQAVTQVHLLSTLFIPAIFYTQYFVKAKQVQLFGLVSKRNKPKNRVRALAGL
jgi:hypothetical protein